MEDWVGQIVGKYRIMERLGSGGMAEVYKAYHPDLERYVAIKFLHAHLIQEEGFVERFQREARAIASLRHPNIVQVFDFDRRGDVYYMVMEFITGPTLKARLQEVSAQRKILPLEETARIFQALGSAIDYAHQQGMVHRDIKPTNIMFTAKWEPVLTDFGIAKIMGGTTHTVTGAMAGTPAYMSPEQAMGQSGDERSDIYSLGVVLYEIATGRIPYEADTPVAIVLKHVRESPPPPRQLNPHLSPALEQVILKALNKAPADRYQTAGAMTAALQAAIAAPGAMAPAFQTTITAPEATSAPAAQPAIPTPTPPPPVAPPKPYVTPTPSAYAAPRETGSRLACWIIALLLGLLVILAGLLVVALVWLPSQQAVPTITIDSPPSGTRVNLNEEVTVISTARDRKGVTRIELWIDGVLSHTAPSPIPQGQTSLTAKQPWTPASVGSHTVQVKAYNVAGAVSASASIAIMVDKEIALKTPSPESTTPPVEATSTPTPTPSPSATRPKPTPMSIPSATRPLPGPTFTFTSTPRPIATPTPPTTIVPILLTLPPTPTDTPLPPPTEIVLPPPTDIVLPPPSTPPLPPPTPVNQISDFETADYWKRGENAQAGSFVQSSEQSHSGSLSGKMSYDFPTAGNDFLVFRTRDKPLVGAISKARVWVYGDGTGHRLKIWFVDSSGEMFQNEFGPVGGAGWQLLETAVGGAYHDWDHWEGNNDGLIDYPLSFNAIVLDDDPDSFIGQGAIYIDDLAVE